MKKTKPSGPAVFMYCVIALAAIAAVLCFALYYGRVTDSEVILWIGVSSFTVMYHFWMRIIMGNVTKLFRISYKHPWFRERAFEKKLYSLLRVRKWRDKVLTYRPELFSVKDRTPEQIATAMAEAEVDHWVNEVISLTTLPFALIWGEFPVFLITAAAAMLFDAQFIVVQRYNRPKLVRLIEKNAKIIAVEKTAVYK